MRMHEDNRQDARTATAIILKWIEKENGRGMIVAKNLRVSSIGPVIRCPKCHNICHIVSFVGFLPYVVYAIIDAATRFILDRFSEAGSASLSALIVYRDKPANKNCNDDRHPPKNDGRSRIMLAQHICSYAN